MFSLRRLSCVTTEYGRLVQRALDFVHGLVSYA